MKIIKYSRKKNPNAIAQRTLANTVSQLSMEMAQARKVTDNFTVTYDADGNKGLSTDITVQTIEGVAGRNTIQS